MVLIGRSGCHLCVQARAVVAQLCAQFNADFTELSCDDDPRLAEQWYELLPVVLLDGVVVSHWWVEEESLRAQLRGAGLTGS